MPAIRRSLVRTLAGRLLGAAVLLSPALPVAAPRAQAPLDPVRVTARSAKAEALDAKALGYETSGRSFKRAAEFRERAAALRAPDDPLGIHSLRMAAFDRYYGNQPDVAGDLMVRAAERALAVGDVVQGAHSYLDAAFIFAGRRDVGRARDVLDRGTLLMKSPLLTSAQRGSLQSRVAQTDGRPATAIALSQP